MEKVSVIVPIYNVEKYLKKCIESIINQSYQNIEILLINDGSTDNCENICKTYQLSDKRIKYYKKENGGLSSARNMGIDHATGTYLMFVDSDDFIDSMMVEKLINLAKKYDASIVECNYFEILENQKTIFKPMQDKIYSSNEAIVALIKNCGITPTAWNKLYATKLFKDIRYKEGIYHEDEEIIVKLLSNCSKIVETRYPLYFYVKRNGSIINSNFNLKHLDIITIMQKRISFLKDLNINSSILGIAQCRLSNIYNEMYGKIILSQNDELDDWKQRLVIYRKQQIKIVLCSSANIFYKLKSTLFYLFPKYITKHIKGG